LVTKNFCSNGGPELLPPMTKKDILAKWFIEQGKEKADAIEKKKKKVEIITID
jgi:hypothetical protein